MSAAKDDYPLVTPRTTESWYGAAMAEIDRLRALSNIDEELVQVGIDWCSTHSRSFKDGYGECLGSTTFGADCNPVPLFYRTPKETQ